MKIFITLIALLVSFNTSARGMNKCEKNGEISYQNSKCSDQLILPVTKPTESALSDSFKDSDSTADKVKNIVVEDDIRTGNESLHYQHQGFFVNQ